MALASWWVAFYLTSMGPLYRGTLRRLGYGAAVDDVLAANPTPRTSVVPGSARVLLDELTIWGDESAARAALDRWSPRAPSFPFSRYHRTARPTSWTGSSSRCSSRVGVFSTELPRLPIGLDNVA